MRNFFKLVVETAKFIKAVIPEIPELWAIRWKPLMTINPIDLPHEVREKIYHIMCRVEARRVSPEYADLYAHTLREQLGLRDE